MERTWLWYAKKIWQCKCLKYSQARQDRSIVILASNLLYLSWFYTMGLKRKLLMVYLVSHMNRLNDQVKNATSERAKITCSDRRGSYTEWAWKIGTFRGKIWLYLLNLALIHAWKSSRWGKKKGLCSKEEYKRTTLRTHNQSHISTWGFRDIGTMIYKKSMVLGPGRVSSAYNNTKDISKSSKHWLARTTWKINV